MLTVKRCVIGVVWAVLVAIGVGLASQQPAEAINCRRNAIPPGFTGTGAPCRPGCESELYVKNAATFCAIYGPGF